MYDAQHYTTQLKVTEPELKNTEVISRLAEMWRDLPADERATYEDAAKDDRYANSPRLLHTHIHTVSTIVCCAQGPPRRGNGAVQGDV